ncbi:GAF and ANTAR domain-containing protein [Gephyromycinifex aptenodytis]|uniref:GAF and ANTAR domain-containing protein n=1 Tax=Gephyromycinifex aptenodytis TaxID=2716227 RepID=UPI00144831E5|nr:GAF and ANTAR domain-containing protein [Gephyromycinifex aptenodytis]
MDVKGPGALVPSAVDFAEAARRMRQPNLQATARQACRSAQELLGCPDAVICVHPRNGEADPWIGVGERAHRLTLLQVECHDGPHVGATEEQTVVIDDVAGESRWPLWSAQAAALGVASYASVLIGERRSHSVWLDLYSDEPGYFTAQRMEHAGALVLHVASALEAAYTEEGLRDAVEGRHLIGVAQGRLIQRYGLEIEQAFAVLKRYSQDKNVKLRVLARHVAETGELPVENEDGSTALS